MLNIQDKFGRTIDYLRISITDRCNLRCKYCMPEEGIKQVTPDEILTYDEIVKIVNYASKQEINHIRITGGEPFVRKDFLTLLERIQHIQGIKDLTLTTNGILLNEYAEELKKIGIKRINVSLDTLQKERFNKITLKHGFAHVKKGIEKILSLGFNPVKINTVIIRGMNDDEIENFVKLTVEYPLHLRFISFMPICKQGEWTPDKYISAKEIRSRFKNLVPIEKIIGNGPAKYFKIPDALGTIGFIDCLGDEFCSQCNRMRLTADGKLRNCLFSDYEIDIKSILRNGGNINDIERIFQKAIENKPRSHPLNYADLKFFKRTMSGIGG